MASPGTKSLPAFTMLEMLIVIVIVGIVAAIAIPRLSRGTEGASDAALDGSLAALRNAIERYCAEHGGSYPTLAGIEQQLVSYTDHFGDAAAAPDATHVFGPYLQKIPPLPVGARKGGTKISDADAPGVGWIYDPATGEIRANTTILEKDAAGVLYRSR